MNLLYVYQKRKKGKSRRGGNFFKKGGGMVIGNVAQKYTLMGRGEEGGRREGNKGYRGE